MNDNGTLDAELAHMDARDETQRARAALAERHAKVARRLDQARDDSFEALRSLRRGMERALQDLGASLGVAAGDDA